MKNDKLFTVGETAKKMDVTVRTLQYYDKMNLLKPSEMSEGGRRLYTQKDMVKLHQVLSLKYLGFSLDEIKTNYCRWIHLRKYAQHLNSKEKL